MESGEIKKYYEWTSGGRVGTVETYLAEDEVNVWFESGRFVLKEQFDYQLRQIDEEVFLMKKNRTPSNQFTPQPQIQNTTDWESLLGNPQPVSIEPPAPKVEKEKSAISIILEKQKKMEVAYISISIPFEFPSTKAIEFMNLMFVEDEVLEELSEFVISQMTDEEMKDAIKEAIKDHIKNSLNN